MRRFRFEKKSGLTLVELSIGVVVLAVLGAGLMQSMTSLRRLTQSSTSSSILQDEASTGLAEIVRDLRRSGFVVPDGVLAFPYTFLDGAAVGDFAHHAHPAALHAAGVGETAFGPTREIVFVLPSDQDDDGDPLNGLVPDGRPDIDEFGDVVWGVEQVSFVLVTRTDGVNVLERRVDGANPRAVARFVERVTFDTSIEDPVNVPIGVVRVRLWMRRLDERGTTHRHFVEQAVRLKNG